MPSRLIFRTLEMFMVTCLIAMVTMVFTNAVLRKLSDYGLTLFGGGITVSEELSRILFVWLTFVGAVVVAGQWGHLGVETLVGKLRGRARIAAMFTSDILVLICCVVLFIGTWRQAPIHADNIAPVTGLPMIWVYGAGFVTSVGIGVIVLGRVIRVLTGRITEEELRQFAGEIDDLNAQPKGHVE
ncbi:TRAP-type C4-dicarboxylate transport system permease small subunit [Rhizobium azooxidifex]|uniref:TRAP transporter small permease protein n=1 Tax=Mycoplana azooxidifex TaxID=1636188 RepID=A0A7W6DG55_9HYPH|nr:TRAP transporter small permease [Mycoplana azooxidifex]MBB3979995.1 TRAP-type C4-dicarboxylate transport system permease small subunit [Mycoplana azooxidifex]